jgi:hypothetical protein
MLGQGFGFESLNWLQQKLGITLELAVREIILEGLML